MQAGHFRTGFVSWFHQPAVNDRKGVERQACGGSRAVQQGGGKLSPQFLIFQPWIFFCWYMATCRSSSGAAGSNDAGACACKLRPALLNRHLWLSKLLHQRPKYTCLTCSTIWRPQTSPSPWQRRLEVHAGAATALSSPAVNQVIFSRGRAGQSPTSILLVRACITYLTGSKGRTHPPARLSGFRGFGSCEQLVTCSWVPARAWRILTPLCALQPRAPAGAEESLQQLSAMQRLHHVAAPPLQERVR